MNTNDSREVAITKYFKPTPEAPSYIGNIIAMIVGVIGVFIGLAGRDARGFLIIGGVIAIWGFLAFIGKQSTYNNAYNAAEPKPSDKQVDEWLNHDKKDIISGAMSKLGLVPEQVLNVNDPLIVIGPKSSAKFKIGDDSIIRFSAYEIVVIYLTNYHLGAYSCSLNFVTGITSSEETKEYHYTDVVSVSTLNSNTNFTVTTVDGKEQPIQTQQQFSLSVASGESIKVTIAFPQVEGFLKNGKLLPSGADKAINALRTMLREKKGGLPAH